MQNSSENERKNGNSDHLSASDFEKFSDAETSVSQLRSIVSEFVNERQWQQFHSPKNLSMSVAIEAAELMEHFQWLTISESQDVIRQPEKLEDVGEELADVLCYALALANVLNLDVTEVIRNKMKKNREKYPVEKFQGNYE